MDIRPVLRYAPSPTGPQHIGGLRTALYCYLLAKRHGGEFILRIEDTDQKRYVKGAEQFIIDACKWVGLEFTQGVHMGGPHAPYRQSERSALYQKYADQLVNEGKAYFAFDTEGELDEMRERLKAAGVDQQTYNYVSRMTMKNSLTLSPEDVQARLQAGEPYVIRFKVPEKEEVRFHDEIRGWVHFHGSHVDDKVIMKSDGLPTYHLANIVDDHMMKVTHVVRGEEWLPSAPLHVLLYRALGWEDSMPKFAHLALMLNPDGSKMSKRKADKFGIPIFPLNWQDTASGETWEGYRDLGYLPEALVSFLALQGWHPGTEQEIMTMDELIAAFSLDRCHHSGAKFDMKKLESFQAHYIRGKSNEELAELVTPLLSEEGWTVDPAKLLMILNVMRERMTFPKDLLKDAPFFFEAPAAYDEKMTKKRWKPDAVELLGELRGRLEVQANWTAEPLHDLFKNFIEEKGVGFGKVMAPLRLALTGISFGPGAFDIAEIIGKAETLDRIDRAMERLASTLV